MANRFGDRIRQLREASCLLQRQVVNQLEIDTPMLSKIERGERKAKKEQVLLLAKILKGDKEELLTLWLADQVVEVVKNEKNALEAMFLAEEQLKYTTKNHK